MKPISELLWQKIDAELDATETEALEARLATEPAARSEAGEIDAIAALLGSVPEVEPPPELRGRIEAALARSRRKASTRRKSFGWSRRLAPPRVAQLAYLAAGLILGVGVVLAVQSARSASPSLDAGSLYGSMGVAPRVAGSWSLPGAGGVVQATRHGDELRLSLAVTGASTRVGVSGGGGLELRRFESLRAAEGAIAVDRSRSVVGRLAAGRYLIDLRLQDAEQAIAFTASAPDGPSLRRIVKLSDLPEDGGPQASTFHADGGS